MDAAHDSSLEDTIAKAIGEELRRARDIVGLTRAELIERMPSDIHSQTLATYERGVRQCTVGRLVEICQALGVSAPDLLRWALQRREIDLPTIGLQIDLHAVVNDKRPDLGPLRRWARGRLSDGPGSGIAHLEWSAIHEMATLFGMARAEFVNRLLTFTPRPLPQRR